VNTFKSSRGVLWSYVATRSQILWYYIRGIVTVTVTECHFITVTFFFLTDCVNNVIFYFASQFCIHSSCREFQWKWIYISINKQCDRWCYCALIAAFLKWRPACWMSEYSWSVVVYTGIVFFMHCLVCMPLCSDYCFHQFGNIKCDQLLSDLYVQSLLQLES
jgi:hypothetical protein